MLVLTRKPKESIVIGGNITVTILNVTGDRISIGVEAPGEISVNRREIEARLARGEPARNPLAIGGCVAAPPIARVG